jgi:hypothetical protein
MSAHAPRGDEKEGAGFVGHEHEVLGGVGVVVPCALVGRGKLRAAEVREDPGHVHYACSALEAGAEADNGWFSDDEFAGVHVFLLGFQA